MEPLVPLFGERLFAAVEKNGFAFTQQYDPFTGEASLKNTQSAYGPTILSVLGYITHLYGIYPHRGDMRFAAMAGPAYTFSWQLGEKNYHMESDGTCVRITLNGLSPAPLPCGFVYTFDSQGNVKNKRSFT